MNARVRRSRRVLFSFCLTLALSIQSSPLNGQSASALDAQFFARSVYPAFEAAGCRGCHAEDGVASTTRLQFPGKDAPPEQIAAFGLRLAALVDRADPRKSLLLQKPTNRIQHTGGERIHPGSEQDAALTKWVDHIARITPEEVAAASKKLAAYRPPAEAGPPMRRLTHSQYNRTVRDLMGVLTQPARRFPPEDYVHGFKNQAAAQSISPTLAQGYAEAAESLASNAFRYGDSGGLIPCRPRDATDAGCAERFVNEFGSRAFRRPLEKGELQRFKELLLTEAGRSADFLKGAQVVVEGLLLSPAFLFHVQAGPEGKHEQYALANRLSYFLWDSMPDKELFEIAARGELSTDVQIEKAVRRMLADPKAREALKEFFTQWLQLDRLATSVKDRRLFPRFSPEVAAAAEEETQRFLEDLVWNDRNFIDFLTADYSFVNSDLAKLYDLPAPETEFGRVQFPEDSKRAGLLGQASFLAATSQPGETSPTVRGLFVRDRLLCQRVPDPPPGVNTDLPPQTEGTLRGTRDRLSMHVSNPTCASCHKLIDGVGFGFEHFDAVGGWRDKQYILYYRTGRDRDQRENAIETHVEIDSRAEVTGIPDSNFSSPRELAKILAANDECRKCVVKQLFRYTFARPETAADGPLIDEMYRRFEASGFHFKELMLALALSNEFRRGN